MAGRQGKPNLLAALNSGLDAVIAEGKWAELFQEWVPRPLPPGWQPGSKAAPYPKLPDITAIAASDPQQYPTAQSARFALGKLGESLFDWAVYQRAIPELVTTGLFNTLKLTLAAAVFGLLYGIVVALMGVSRFRWLRWPARLYIDIFRGMPEVIVIVLIVLGVGPILGGLLVTTPGAGYNPYLWSILALSLLAVAQIGETLRAGLQRDGVGQFEAGRLLGVSYWRALRVVVPQNIRQELPALVDQLIWLLKTTALVQFVQLFAGQLELFQVGFDLNTQTGNLSPLMAAGLLYLAVAIPLRHLSTYLEDRNLRSWVDVPPQSPEPFDELSGSR